MDEGRFDALARIIGDGNTASRRAAVKAVIGGAVGAVALLAHDAGPLRAQRRKRRGRRRPGNVAVCHNGKTLHLPRYAVQGILLSGGTRGACEGGGQTPPPGGGSGAGLKNVRVIMENHTNRAIDFEGIVPFQGTSCVTRFLETVQPTLAPEFVSNSPSPNALIDEKVFVEFRDRDPDRGFPTYDVSLGGTVNRDDARRPCYTAEIHAPCFFSSDPVQLNVGQKKLVRTADACGPGIEIERSGDDPGGDRVFRIRVNG